MNGSDYNFVLRLMLSSIQKSNIHLVLEKAIVKISTALSSQSSVKGCDIGYSWFGQANMWSFWNIDNQWCDQ